MDFGDSAELTAFRIELREWLARNHIEPTESEPRARFLQRWHQQLALGGWVGLSWPMEFGGRDLSATHEAILNEEIGAAGAPDAPRIGYLARAILTHGSGEQKNKYIRPLLNGTHFWCQGFSEPSAGSDLANLTTTATLLGDRYIVNGQKVWTSYGEFADYCLLLARTGPPGGRHKGISAFILPMNASGIDVRPMRAITGESEFCEMFLTDVELSRQQLLGQEGDGWAIAMMTVAYERGAADVGYLSKFGAALSELREQIPTGKQSDSNVERDVGRLEVQLAVLNYHIRRRMRERELSPGTPGPEMSVDKLLMTDVDQSIHEASLHLLGADALADEGNNDWFKAYLYSRAASIYGGSQQIQLNIIAQRLLDLPRS